MRNIQVYTHVYVYNACVCVYMYLPYTISKLTLYPIITTLQGNGNGGINDKLHLFSKTVQFIINVSASYSPTSASPRFYVSHILLQATAQGSVS